MRPVLVLLATLAATACTRQEPTPHAATSQTPTPSVALEGRVDIVAWPGYIERGETDRRYDWVTPFESATGCKVNVKTAGTSDEMVTLMAQGGYDLVTASGDASVRLIREGIVQPVDIGRIPSYGTIDARLKETSWHFVDGRHYGVPYQWGPNVLLFNTSVFPSPPTSWSIVFSEETLPDGRSNKGRVQAYHGAIYIADAALYLMATQPSLGIADPYELSEAQYAATLELLRRQRSLIQRYWHDSNGQIQDFTDGHAVVSGSWRLQANTLIANGQLVGSTIPEEGVTGWADTTMLHAQAKHPNCAYRWMEWSITPKVQGDVASWFGSLPVVPEACNGNDLLGAEGCKTNGYENFEHIHFWRTPGARCVSQNDTCVPYSRWAADYAAIMSGR